MLSVSHSSCRLNNLAPLRACVSRRFRTVKARYHQAPQRFCCALQCAQNRLWSQQLRHNRNVSASAGKADSGKAETSDTSAKKDKTKDKLDSNLDKADSKADSKADGKTESKAEIKAEKKASRYSAWPRVDLASAEPPRQDASATASQGLRPVHLATFFTVLGTGLMFLAVLLWFTADIRFQQACVKVIRRLFKTVALRQVMGILGAMTFVRLGLEPMVKMLRRLFRAPGTWEKSAEFYILREVHTVQGLFCRSSRCCYNLLPLVPPANCCMLQVYRPLEFLFTIAAFTTLAENFLPQLIALPKVTRTASLATHSLHFTVLAGACMYCLAMAFSAGHKVKCLHCFCIITGVLSCSANDAGHDPELCAVNPVANIRHSSRPCCVQHQSSYGTGSQLAARVEG